MDKSIVGTIYYLAKPQPRERTWEDLVEFDSSTHV